MLIMIATSTLIIIITKTKIKQERYLTDIMSLELIQVSVHNG